MTSNREIKIVACGDIALCGGVEKRIQEGKGHLIAKDFRNIISEADVVLANIECPLTNSNKPKWDYFSTLKASRETGRILGELGITVASLANNHIADYDKIGLQDTIAVLEEQGISWVGADFDAEHATRPLVVHKNGFSIGILALAQPEISAAKNGRWGAGVLKERIAAQKIGELRESADVVIAFLHYGVEFCNYPTPSQIRLSRTLINAGAKMVIGHHPHVPQGYEFYNNGFIAYSLGNFIFDMNSGSEPFTNIGLLINSRVTKEKVEEVQVIPVNTKGADAKSLKENEQQETQRFLSLISRVLSDTNELRRSYYINCRDNFYLFLDALFVYGIKKANYRRIKHIISTQLWPQIYNMRIDLLKFLLSGDAYRFELSRKKSKLNPIFIIWKGFCGLCKILGTGWGRFLRVDVS